MIKQSNNSSVEECQQLIAVIRWAVKECLSFYYEGGRERALASYRSAGLHTDSEEEEEEEDGVEDGKRGKLEALYL